MKIYTRTGDSGSTAVLGGDRFAKDHPRIEAYGSVDEVNAFVGLARASGTLDDIDPDLAAIQSDLFDLGAHLAAPGLDQKFPPPAAARIEALEIAIDRMESELEPLRNFILPGGTPAAAALHVARTVCRRAERAVVTLGDDRGAVVYLNRLSDYLFVAARHANRRAAVPDVPWHPAR